MEKKIIALAIASLASSAAFAQSNVTISGNLDIGYRSHTFQSNIIDAKTAALHNGSSTSSIVFSGKEDIGGGMSVGFRLNTEPAFGSTTNTLFGSESYLEVDGGFGSLRAGTVNNTSLIVGAVTAQPFGTAIGSGFSGNFGRLSRTGATVAGATGASAVTAVSAEGEAAAGTSGSITVRTSNSLKYTSPDLSGLKLSLQYAAKNADTAAGVVGTQTPSMVELGATYSNGPLNVGYANMQYAQGGVANVLGVNEKVTHNLIAANYTFGPATIYGGWTSSKQSGVTPATADSRSWNLALKYALNGAINLMANVVKVDDKITTVAAAGQDRSLTGLGVDYALSKRSTAYARYETGDNDKSNGAGGNFTRWGVGLRHTF